MYNAYVSSRISYGIELIGSANKTFLHKLQVKQNRALKILFFKDYETPTSYEVSFSDPYAAHGLLDCANIYHQQYLNAGIDYPDVAWIWEDDDEEEED